MLRRVFMPLLLLPAMAALPVARGAAAGAPGHNLVVEARVVERGSAVRQGLTGAGGVVTGTVGSTVAAGSRVLRAGAAETAHEQTQRVLVVNGGSAVLRLARWLPLESVEWVWTPQGGAAAQRTVWVDVSQGLQVRPSWPGAQAPVLLDLAVEAADAASAEGARAPRMAVRTQVAAALGEWVPVAGVSQEGTAAAAAPGVTVATSRSRSERSIEVRVTLP